jgi:cyclopropane-fatty-acyl-phospholipid synthase
MSKPLLSGFSDTIVAQLRGERIYPPGSPPQVRLEADVARFLGREYQRYADCPPTDPVVTDRGPILSEPASLMERHYDADLSLFASFLDCRYMAYSMAWYGDEAEAVRASRASLVEAQRAKLALVVQRAMIAGDETVLDLGCGFGPLETFLAETFPRLKVTAVTASRIQGDYIRRCLQRPEHPLGGNDLRLVQGEFGAMSVDSLGADAYDRVLAIAVLEQAHNLRAAFSKIAALLRPGGRAFLHLITSRVTIPRLMDADRSLVSSYFPGGRVWPFETVAQNTAPLQLEASWFINGLNYWRTLDEWHQTFWRNLPGLFAGSLDTAGVRHWNQYFSLCKACFAPFDGSSFGVGHFLLRKPD